jgi:hypothetical protein
VADVDPDELAVPAELVPGVLGAFAALPAPLGSLPELLRPPTLAGPVTPLMAAVPAPAEPALGAPAPPLTLRRRCLRKGLRQIHHLPRRRLRPARKLA